MEKKYLEIVVGALAGLAGTLAKRGFYRISVEREVTIPKGRTRQFRMSTSGKKVLSDKRKIPRRFLDLGLGVLGGIGTYYLQKGRGRRVGLAGSLTIGSFIDSAQRKPKKKSWAMNLVANGIYGLTTIFFNTKLMEIVCPKDPIEKCMEEIKLRTIRREKVKIKRFMNGKLSLRKTPLRKTG